MAVTFVFFCIAVIGMSSILMEGEIFAPLRNSIFERVVKIRKIHDESTDTESPIIDTRKRNRIILDYMVTFFHGILSCSQCCGTWCGFFLGAALLSWNPFWIFAAGCVGSVLSPLYEQFNLYVLSIPILQTEEN